MEDIAAQKRRAMTAVFAWLGIQSIVSYDTGLVADDPALWLGELALGHHLERLSPSEPS